MRVSAAALAVDVGEIPDNEIEAETGVAYEGEAEVCGRGREMLVAPDWDVAQDSLIVPLQENALQVQAAPCVIPSGSGSIGGSVPLQVPPPATDGSFAGFSSVKSAPAESSSKTSESLMSSSSSGSSVGSAGLSGWGRGQRSSEKPERRSGTFLELEA